MAYHGCPHSSTAYNAIISCTAEKWSCQRTKT
jgi:hypothetical protein